MKLGTFTAMLLAGVFTTIVLVTVALFLKVQLDYYLATIGTVVTSLAFAFGTYFVVIAIDAYSQLQSVRSNAERAEHLAGSLSLKEAHFKDIQKEFRDLEKRVSGVGEKLHQSAEKILQIVVDHVLSLPAQSKRQEPARERFLKQAHCIRNRFLLASQYSTDDERRMAVLGLMQYNDVEAVPLIQDACDHAKDPQLREICLTALQKIRVI
jgi:hypothetical protein